MAEIDVKINVTCAACGLPPDLCICSELAKEEQRIHSKAVECCYSHKCKLCGEEIVWSIVEHLQDKHKDLPETKEINKKINELWKKFVESS